jgi:hypothetical protein
MPPCGRHEVKGLAALPVRVPDDTGYVDPGFEPFKADGSAASLQGAPNQLAASPAQFHPPELVPAVVRRRLNFARQLDLGTRVRFCLGLIGR